MDDFYFQIDLGSLVQIVINFFYDIIEMLVGIEFEYSRGTVDITFSFWTFLVVVFVLDVLAFCLMGVEKKSDD